ncbi:MAG: hypothetical protein IPK82_02475 [Polyangiaceae bacterium]|nr:hypothetical protein [Polyangiaceae bacterium]
MLATIPTSYSPAVHFLVPGALGMAVLAAAIWFAHDVKPLEWLTIPITLFLGFGLEWRVHKSVLHKKMPLLGILYVRHELHHHVIYTYDDMTMRSSREWRLVLMPAYAIVLVFVGVVPLVAGLWFAITPNVALIHLATSMVFFLSYEWLHLAYHLPPQHPIGRLSLIRTLRELHRRHHDPRLMKRWNFNVTVPVFDWIHRSAWSEKREAEWRAKRARQGKPVD